MVARAWVVVPAVLALAACSTEARTEVIVVVDSDMTVPDELDEITIAVQGPDMGEPRLSTATLGPGEPGLPRMLGLVHETGELGPFAVQAVGRHAGTDTVGRMARFRFQPHRTLVLTMHLLRRCTMPTCAVSTTCGETGCRPVDVAADELLSWTGEPPRLDAGGPEQDAGPTPDAGPGMDGAVDGCASSTEVCNGMDDDCDGMTDEDFDLSMDQNNCGTCGNVCTFAHGSGTCSSGSCVVSACDPGFDNCDGTDSNGCEADLSLPATCGDCATTCRSPDRDCCTGVCGRC